MMDVDGGFTICLLSDDLLQTVFSYLDLFFVYDLMRKTKQKWWCHKLYTLMYSHTFFDYGRISVRSDVPARILYIQKKKSLSTKRNACGYSFGDHVRVNYDNENDYWSRHYRPSRHAKKTGFIVGTTDQYVYVAVGNLWSSDVDVLKKKNWNVSRVGIG